MGKTQQEIEARAVAMLKEALGKLVIAATYLKNNVPESADGWAACRVGNELDDITDNLIQIAAKTRNIMLQQPLFDYPNESAYRESCLYAIRKALGYNIP